MIEELGVLITERLHIRPSFVVATISCLFNHGEVLSRLGCIWLH
jgi:hypothetical protein